MKCIVGGCEAPGTEPVEVGFNELRGHELEPAREQIWVCAPHEKEIAQEIIASLDA